MRKFFKEHPEYSYDQETGEIFGKSGRALKPAVDHKGYLRVCFCENGKQEVYLAHRLICEAEHENPDNLETVDHIDGNKGNNSAENLRWMTRSENSSIGQLGKTFTDEHRKHLSESRKGKKIKPFTDAHRENISESLKKYWQNKKRKDD